MNLPEPIDNLVKEFSRLPSVGFRTAEKIVLYLLKKPRFDLERFSGSILEAKDKVDYCKNCCMLTDKSMDLCSICRNPKKDVRIICVVSEISDLISIEKSGNFSGVYHVLHGELSPLDGVGPEHLFFDKLWERLTGGNVEEIILANNPTFEGESTAIYIKRFVKERFPEIRLTQLAQGIPQGGSVEYMDHITLGKAMEGRKEI